MSIVGEGPFLVANLVEDFFGHLRCDQRRGNPIVHRAVGQSIRRLGRQGAEEQFAPEDDLPKFIFPFLFLFA